MLLDKELNNENIEVTYSSTVGCPTHSHNFLELAFIISGNATHFINGKPVAQLRAGDYFIVDYGMDHHYSSIDGNMVEVINVLFLPALIDNTLLYCRSFTGLLKHYLIKINFDNLKINPSGTVFHDDDGKIHELVKSLKNEYEVKELGFTEIMRCALIQLIVITMRKITEITDTGNVVDYIVSLIEKDVANPPTLSYLADKLGYSVPHICTKIKKSLGIGYREYISRVRIDEARRLLANTDKKISEIAELVGYNDIAFFYAVFKKQVGASPSVFRKSSQIHR